MKLSRHFYTSLLVLALAVTSVAAFAADVPIYLRKETPQTPAPKNTAPGVSVIYLRKEDPDKKPELKTHVYIPGAKTARKEDTSVKKYKRPGVSIPAGPPLPKCTTEKLAALKNLQEEFEEVLGSQSLDKAQRDRGVRNLVAGPARQKQLIDLYSSCGAYVAEAKQLKNNNRPGKVQLSPGVTTVRPAQKGVKQLSPGVKIGN